MYASDSTVSFAGLTQVFLKTSVYEREQNSSYNQGENADVSIFNQNRFMLFT